MFIATNRRLDESKSGLRVFDKRPNEKGPNELRLVKVTKPGRSYKVEVLGDVLKTSEVKKINETYDLALDTDETHYVSLRVAVESFDEARQAGKHILFYTHGYNNDLNDIVDTAAELESRYNVVVIVFSWPSNGGGTVSGAAAYLRDKRDARASADAFGRFAGFVRHYHQLVVQHRVDELTRQAHDEFPDDLSKAREAAMRAVNAFCTVSLNLLCHSMGNYLLKYALKPGESPLKKLTFDNVCLVAADTNNEGHAEWVDALDVGNRTYIVINANDFALAWSRRKPGDEQKDRLGNTLNRLDSREARYVNVSETDWVDDKHGYFKGEAVDKNVRLRNLFADLFEGRVAEDNSQVGLRYRSDVNVYELD